MVATGGTALDPTIVEALVRPVTSQQRALGRPRRRCSPSSPRASPSRPSRWPRRLPPEAVDAQVEAMFTKLADEVSAGQPGGARRACVTCTRRSSTARSRARPSRDSCPAGSPRSCATRGAASARPSASRCTVVMSDIRSYSTIAEHADPSQLAGQLNTHRAAMNRAIIGEGGTVMQFVGDAVMAVFGAPVPQARPRRPGRGRGRRACTRSRPRSTSQWSRARTCPSSGSGSACPPARWPPRCSGSEERLEYTLVGDTVNLSQRLQQLGLGRRDRDLGATTRRALGRGRDHHARRRSSSRAATRPSSPTRSSCATPRSDRASSNAQRRRDTMTTTRTDTPPSGTIHARRRSRCAASARPSRPRSPRCGPCAASTSPSSADLHRPDGSLGVRQVDAAQSDRRARGGRRGDDHRGGRIDDRRAPRTTTP